MIGVEVWVPDSLLINATGSTLIFIYASVGLCGVRIARARSGSWWSRRAALPGILLAMLGFMTVAALAADPASVLTAVGLMALGAGWYTTWRTLSGPG